jgi:hypothetical protein
MYLKASELAMTQEGSPNGGNHGDRYLQNHRLGQVHSAAFSDAPGRQHARRSPVPSIKVNTLLFPSRSCGSASFSRHEPGDGTG